MSLKTFQTPDFPQLSKPKQQQNREREKTGKSVYPYQPLKGATKLISAFTLVGMCMWANWIYVVSITTAALIASNRIYIYFISMKQRRRQPQRIAAVAALDGEKKWIATTCFNDTFHIGDVDKLHFPCQWCMRNLPAAVLRMHVWIAYYCITYYWMVATESWMCPVHWRHSPFRVSAKWNVA